MKDWRGISTTYKLQLREVFCSLELSSTVVARLGLKKQYALRISILWKPRTQECVQICLEEIEVIEHVQELLVLTDVWGPNDLGEWFKQ